MSGASAGCVWVDTRGLESEPCGHPAWKKGLCIFHAPKPIANDEAFHQAFAELLARLDAEEALEIWRFVGFQLPMTSLRGRTFPKDVDFTGATFSAGSDFGEVHFGGGATFADATFEDWVTFEGVSFSRAADFRRATFNQMADFDHVSFSEEVDFGGVIFSDWVKFGDEATFNGEAYFNGATFGGANFSGACFRSEAVFSKSTFGDGASFAGSGFHGEASFDAVEFGEDADFSKATCGFDTDFSQAVFGPGANFSEATFGSTSHFKKATFRGQSAFMGTEFHSETIFDQAVFKGATSFMRAAFSGGAHFRRATFHETTTFWETKFGTLAVFDRCTFGRRVEFRGKDDDRCFYGACSFQRLEIPKEALVVFEKVNLARASLLGTDLEKATFRDVKWHRAEPNRTPLARRVHALADEFPTAGQEPAYPEVARNYRQLVLNYEARREYEVAEDFYIGEMEARRKQMGAGAKGPLRVILRWLNGYGLYLLLSRYRSSYVHALIALLLLVLLFSDIFMATGFRPSRESLGIPMDASGGAPQARTVEYNAWPWLDAEHPALWWPWQWQVLGDYWEAVLFTLSVVTFQRDRFYEPANGLARFWLYLAVIALTGQVALVFFAIRRRFKR